MRILKNYSFDEWAKSEKISDDVLRRAIHELNNGLFDANLGSHLYKKRIARLGQGKRGGYRTIIALSIHERAIFMFGFAKNERENMTHQEEVVYKKLAKLYLELSDHQINTLIQQGEFTEVQQ